MRYFYLIMFQSLSLSFIHLSLMIHTKLIPHAFALTDRLQRIQLHLFFFLCLPLLFLITCPDLSPAFLRLRVKVLGGMRWVNGFGLLDLGRRLYRRWAVVLRVE